MRVLVTRPAPDGERTARRLAALGHEPVLSPVISIEPTQPPPRLIPGPLPDVILVTSANALRAVEHHRERADLQDLPLLAVGARTAALAERMGFRDVEAAGGTATSLIEMAWERMSEGGTALYLAGRNRAVDIAAALGPSGIDVSMVVVYAAQAEPHMTLQADLMLREDALDVVLHHSARSAALLLAQIQDDPDLWRAAAGLTHLCLSQQVATALKPLGGETVLIARQPDEKSLLDLLKTLARNEEAE
jgi:uroporphyrinogen-III synthase